VVTDQSTVSPERGRVEKYHDSSPGDRSIGQTPIVVDAPSGENHGRPSNGIFEVWRAEQFFAAIEDAVDALPGLDELEEGEPTKLRLSALAE
jgi:hypothetical protein